MKSFVLKIACACLFSLAFLTNGIGQASNIDSEQLRKAREIMNDIEEQLLRTSDNKEASALILESKLANESAFVYLVQLPGYEQAMASDSLLYFQDEMRKEYKDYRKLSKEARKTVKKKREFISAINEDYQRAYEMYQEVY